MSRAVIDLRSDTLTLPTDTMRAAMAEAEVGDDVYGEDPTVRRLEERVAAMLGKAAALFLPTGTMANQVAIHVHTRPGDEVLIEAMAHGFEGEVGAAAALSGAQLRPVSGEAGVLGPDVLAPLLLPRQAHQPRVTLLMIEDTHNMAGGRVVPLEVLEASAGMARASGLRTHLDGARLFNASVASGVPLERLAAPFDTVMVSLSKGLSAPVGSLLAGAEDVMAAARRVRRMFGGGMRQAGVLAAAGLVALREGIDRLAVDHANAARLGEGLVATGGARLAYGHCDTNILVLDVSPAGLSAADFCAAAAAAGVACAPAFGGHVRLVTHRHVSGADVDVAIARLAPLLSGGC